MASTTDSYFLSVLEPGSPRSRSQQGWCLVRALPLDCRQLLSCHEPHCLSRKRGHQGNERVRIRDWEATERQSKNAHKILLNQDCILRTSRNLNFLLQEDPIDRFGLQILGRGFKIWIWGGGGTTNTQSIVVVLPDETNSTLRVVLTQCPVPDHLHVETPRTK